MKGHHNTDYCREFSRSPFEEQWRYFPVHRSQSPGKVVSLEFRILLRVITSVSRMPTATSRRLLVFKCCRVGSELEFTTTSYNEVRQTFVNLARDKTSLGCRDRQRCRMFVVSLFCVRCKLSVIAH